MTNNYTYPTSDAYDILRDAGMPKLERIAEMLAAIRCGQETLRQKLDARDILTMHALRWLAAKVMVKDTCWLEIAMPEEEGGKVDLWRKIANGDNDPLAQSVDLLDAIVEAAKGMK